MLPGVRGNLYSRESGGMRQLRVPFWGSAVGAMKLKKGPDFRCPLEVLIVEVRAVRSYFMQTILVAMQNE
jgi:hypothetical protein